MKHNHLTRNIRHPGECAGCDSYWLRNIVGCAAIVADPDTVVWPDWRPCPPELCERPDHDHEDETPCCSWCWDWS